MHRKEISTDECNCIADQWSVPEKELPESLKLHVQGTFKDGQL